MAASSSTISCCRIKPPSPAPPPPPPRLSHRLRRACVAAAACAVIATTAAAGGGTPAAVAVVHARAQAEEVEVAAARWSERRQCPPWRSNSLENVVPENLPRPSDRRRFNSVTAAAAERSLAPPDAVAPFLALHSGMGCFSL